MVQKQIDKFHASGITYKEIARAVYYMFQVQGRDAESVSTYGIGLVPGIKDEANQYYEQIKQRQEKQANQVRNFKKVSTKEVTPLKRKNIKKGIDINGI